MMRWWPAGCWFAGMNPLWMGISWIISLAVTVIIMWLIVRTLNTFVISGHHIRISNAEKILDERFARGEITEEEYRKMRETLRNR